MVLIGRGGAEVESRSGRVPGTVPGACPRFTLARGPAPGSHGGTLPFRLLPQFEREPARAALAHRGRIDETCVGLFPGDSLGDRLARALAARRALPFKEVLESYEFFAATRREVRSPVVADLCSGHGLVGLLFALFERRVEQVVSIERRPPPSREKVLEAVCEVGPWVADKVRLADGLLKRRRAELAPGTAIVAVHACGLRTDEALDLAVGLGGPVAVMPCCRPHGRSPAPGALQRALGGDLAFDVDRTYRLERAGYHVRWTEVPEAITPMNRVLVARPRREAARDQGRVSR